MPTRIFNLNSPEAYEALCEPRERAWIPNGSLPREPRWPDRSDPLIVSGRASTTQTKPRARGCGIWRRGGLGAN